MDEKILVRIWSWISWGLGIHYGSSLEANKFKVAGTICIAKWKKYFTKTVVRQQAASQEKWSWHRACQSSRGIWTMLSDICLDFWVVLCGAASSTQWSLLVPSDLGYSVTLWYPHKDDTGKKKIKERMEIENRVNNAMTEDVTLIGWICLWSERTLESRICSELKPTTSIVTIALPVLNFQSLCYC